MANITVTASTSNVNVNSTTNQVNVSTTTSNIVVGTATTVNVDEIVVQNGNKSGDITLDLNAGRLHELTIVGDITGITLNNLVSGSSATIVITQNGIGGNKLDVTTTPSNWSIWNFANNFTDIDLIPNHWTAINLFYDGSEIYASVVVEDALSITNADLANANIIVNNPTTTTNATLVLGSNTTFSADLISDGSSQTAFKTGANNITTGNVTASFFLGDGSALSNLPASGIGLSNLSVTQASASGSGTLAYNNSNGVFTYTPPVLTSFIDLTDLSVSQSSASGTGTLAYNNGSGVFTYTPPDLSSFGTSNLTNAQVITHIATGALAVGGNLSVTGNIDATGNINYQNVTDLFVRDQKITLNANATTDATVEVISNRPQSTYDAKLIWNEPSEVWQFMNGDNTSHNMLTSASARALVSATDAGGLGSFAYNNGTGVFTYTGPADADIRGLLSTATPATPSGGGALAYNSTTGAFTFTPAVPGIALTALSTATASPSSGGALAYDNSSGVFTFTPAVPGIALSALSMATPATPSGNGSLSYDNTSGEFTFTPADTSLATKSTTNLAEGTNLYYTDARSRAAVSVTQASASGTGALAYNNGTGVFTYTPPVLPTGDIEGVTAGVGLSGGGTTGTVTLNLDPTITTATASGDGSLAYDNSSGVFTFTPADTSLATKTTTNLAEGTNLYYTNARADARITAYTGALTNLTGNITTTANVSGNFYIGNGSLLTGVTSSLAANITVDQINFPVASTANSKPSIKITHDNANSVDFTGVKNIYGVDRNNGYEYDDVRVVTGPTKRFQVNQTLASNAQLETNYLTVETNGTLYIAEGNITASSSENITLDSGEKNVKISKTLAGVKYDQLTFNNQGWAPTSYKTNPVYNGTAERVAYVMEGTTTAGSNVLTVTTAAEFQDAFGTNNFNGNAPTAGGRTAMFTGTNAIATNYIGRARGTLTSGCFPFPNGIRIQSIDTTAFTITMDRPANETATLSWNGGGSDTDIFLIAAGAFGYTDTTRYSETYFSSYDFQQLGSGSTSKVTLAFSELSNQDSYGFGKTGPSWGSPADINVSIGSVSDYTAPTYNTRGKVALEGETTFINSNYGVTVGANASLSNRINNDQFTGFGYNQLWDGTEDYSTDFGTTNAIPQIGTKQYTDGSLQATTPYLGTRIQFNSAYGQITDNPTQWYPRTGQELGRMGWWGSHGDLENPSSTAAPAYISVQAADEWTNGSNASMYFVATSDYSKTYREPFISYEKGNLILAGGNVAGVTQNITFAPAKRAQDSGANPAGTYDFVPGPNATQAFGTVNYADTSANSGAEISINNGGSIGAGTVGDMKMSIHRKDNSYALPEVTATIVDLFPKSASGALNADVVKVTGGVIPTGTANAYTFSGITDSNWTFLNGNTYSLSGSLFTGYTEIYETNGTAVIQGGGFASGVSAGVYKYTDSAASGVTDKEWSLTLAEQSEDLVLKGNTTTQVTFTNARSKFDTSLQLKSYTSTQILALSGPAAGDVVYNSTANLVAYHDGTNWRNIAQGAIIT